MRDSWSRARPSGASPDEGPLRCPPALLGEPAARPRRRRHPCEPHSRRVGDEGCGRGGLCGRKRDGPDRQGQRLSRQPPTCWDPFPPGPSDPGQPDRTPPHLLCSTSTGTSLRGCWRTAPVMSRWVAADSSCLRAQLERAAPGSPLRPLASRGASFSAIGQVTAIPGAKSQQPRWAGFGYPARGARPSADANRARPVSRLLPGKGPSP